MFGLSFTHLVLLAIITLVFIGPEQLPEVARTVARLLNEWRRATGEIQNSLANTLRDDAPPAKKPVTPQQVDAAPVPLEEPMSMPSYAGGSEPVEPPLIPKDGEKKS